MASQELHCCNFLMFASSCRTLPFLHFKSCFFQTFSCVSYCFPGCLSCNFLSVSMVLSTLFGFPKLAIQFVVCFEGVFTCCRHFPPFELSSMPSHMHNLCHQSIVSPRLRSRQVARAPWHTLQFSSEFYSLLAAVMFHPLVAAVLARLRPSQTPDLWRALKKMLVCFKDHCRTSSFSAWCSSSLKNTE